MITAVDTNILIDILEPDPIFGPGSRDILKQCLREGSVIACEVVWAEVSVSYADNRSELIDLLDRVGIQFSAMSLDAALESAECWHSYLKGGGKRDRIAADFLIGGHASVQSDRLLTRDQGFYRRYFKNLVIESP